MPKRTPKRTGTAHDFTVIARRVVERAIGEHLDGSPLDRDQRPTATIATYAERAERGGKARAKALTSERRKAIARKAAKARWTR